MNFKTATFREALGKRGMTVARLARAAKMNPTQLRHVLNEKRRGRLTPVASRQEDTGAEEKEGSRCLKF
jgi:lambda repressor-like predicted transcriptional regulator